MFRSEVSGGVKPGRLEDAITDMHAANEATQRVLGADSAWIAPAAREGLRQVV